MLMDSRPRGFPLDGLRDARLVRHFAYVGGAWTAAVDGAAIDVTNPADGASLGDVAALGRAQSHAAVDAAQGAFHQWASLLPQQRAETLRRWYEQIIRNREDLARIMTLEQGKPISEARAEIDYAASFVEFYAEEARRANVEGVTSHLAGAEMEVRLEPAGVAALITPWNFPCAMITRKAAAALAAGCTVVVHPSHETPFSALALAELAERAGLPEGVINFVTGQPTSVVPPWLSDERVRVLSFTGSTEIGRLLFRQSADTMKRLVMELGGHAPFIVFADADLDRAAAEAVKAKFATSGQDCLAVNRFYVEASVHDEFCRRFAERVERLAVGPGLSDPDIGPLINMKAIEKQVEHVQDACAKGARILAGGEPHEAGPLFFRPTVLADVPDDALVMREETFGPVAAVTSFGTEAEVVARANATEYGLIAYLHTRDHGRIGRVSRALEYGMVAVNRTKVTGAPVPFGGRKQSGLGREGSRHGMAAFMEMKYVCRDLD